MDQSKTICLAEERSHTISCMGATAIEGISIIDHLFLITLLPCCAQIALPYWAKIAGRIENMRTEDMLLEVVITLYDNQGNQIDTHSDMVALDGLESSQFEVKLTDYQERVHQYKITVKEAEQF